MLVENILLCNMYSPPKWKGIYYEYFKKCIKIVLKSRTKQLFGDFTLRESGGQWNMSESLWRSLFG